ncbi:OmpW/AlkL family protein [Flavobacterium sp. I3-2]|uniref:OmpW/AlkL family protein n=1 Tax=Flavobacterium sp. I3-2 TaxID=2748319 RepID=UPI0015B24ED4|nr:OmpW family outer membrane protein [Flavobacterium sp. I3-2]
MKKLVLSMIAILGMSSTLFAQEANNSKETDYKKWQVRLRGVGVIPNPSAKIGTIGGGVDISTTFIPELDFTYFFTKNIAAELILGTSKHKVHTTGSNLTAVGLPNNVDVDLGSVMLLPPTLTAQYHFYPGEGAFAKPYVGAGINYTIFYNVKSGNMIKDVKYENRAAFALQAGSDFNIGKDFFVNVDVKYLFLKTDVTVDASNLVNGNTLDIPAEVKINPLLVGVGVGYRF